jgi:hypothetical protein
MNTYDKLEKIKKSLIDYNYELMKYMNEDASEISIKKVQSKILNILNNC